MPDIDGERGELIDAFLSLIDPSEHGDTDRLMHAEMVLALTVGGAALSRVKLALPDVPVKPGSVGDRYFGAMTRSMPTATSMSYARRCLR